MRRRPSKSYRRPPAELATPWRQLLARIADAENLPRNVATGVVERFIAELPEMVWARGRLVVPGLATFRVRTQKARRIADPREPRTAHMQLPAARVVAARVVGSWRRRG